MGGGRAPCCDKNNVKRGPWSPAEDLRLAAFIQKHGHGNWRSLPKQAGLLRCGKSCRLRWINYLSPNVKRGNFTLEEEEAIIKLHQSYGNKWSKIAAELPGRTDNEIKNVWNTHLKKRLLLPGKYNKHEKIDEIKNNNNSSPIIHSSSNSPASSTTTTSDTWRGNRGVAVVTSDDHDQNPDAKMTDDILPKNCPEKETSRSNSFSSNESNFSSSNTPTPLPADQNVAKPREEMDQSLFSFDSNLQELLNELDVMESEFDLWNVLENFEDPQNQSSNFGDRENNNIINNDIELSEWYRYLKNNEVGLVGIIGEEEKNADQNVDEVLCLEPEIDQEIFADSFPFWPASPHNI